MNSLLLSIPVLILGALATVWLGGPIVGRIVAPYADQLNSESGLIQGGRMIGYSERLLIYVFVLVDAPTAIGFLIAAKSIYSFGESGNEPHKRSQYVVIGTLVSFAYAVTLSYLVRWVLTVGIG